MITPIAEAEGDSRIQLLKFYGLANGVVLSCF